jgi:hypothetical protein
MRRSLVAASLFLALALACSGDDDASPTATPTLVASATRPPPTTTFTMPATGTPEAQRVPSTVWLIDVEAGRLITLYEDFENRVTFLDFTPRQDGVRMGVQELEEPRDRFAIRFRLDGDEIEREEWSWPPEPVSCNEQANDVSIQGQLYEDVSCGLVSPDGHWMTYAVDVGETPARPGSDYIVPVWDQWLINLETDERRRRQERLLSCGGCDSRFGPAWSAGSRFLYFGESGGEQRTFLSDVQDEGAIVIDEGNTGLGSEPDWSPSSELLVYRGPNDLTILLDPTTGTLAELTEMPWPSRFDATGRFLYSPAWERIGRDDNEDAVTTAIYDVATRSIVATLPGHPIYQSVFTGYVPLGASSEGVVAALYGTPNCAGTVIYEETRAVTCVEGATGPSVSPDGRLVALTRKTGEAGLFEYPGGGSVNDPVYEVVIVDVATGAERVLAEGAVGDPPPLIWNEAGTLLLLRWPFHYGI